MRTPRVGEVSYEANVLRLKHKVSGGVFLLFLEDAACSFGVAIPDAVQREILALLPGRLRDCADQIERGMEWIPYDHNPLE